MEFVETPLFRRRIAGLLSEEQLRRMQNTLIQDSGVGEVIPGTRGLRKLRWALPGRGKSGGLRVIYAWIPLRNTILLLLAYAKNEQEDLTPIQKKLLNSIVEAELP